MKIYYKRLWQFENNLFSLIIYKFHDILILNLHHIKRSKKSFVVIIIYICKK
jgi:hypothetical protein